ncbi:luciferin sulfotransferase-like [Melitaea cinxia]|uniref:luciferin sulfotransferase-like n=1 Tax=Melitaea cinxia TaxID=113334 RepID=UPI001E270C7C|nr:luciferin sulfotransferase-like [Melitaea cinxia]
MVDSGVRKSQLFSESIPLKFIQVGPKRYFLVEDFMAEEIYNFPVNSSDVFVASFPKSGTTWTQELVWLLENGLDYDTAKSTSLAKRFPFLEISMFPAMEKPIYPLTIDDIRKMPSPRYIKTHLPLSLLPLNLLDKTKVVYIARDPRDVAISFFHHNRLMRIMSQNTDFKTYWNYFINNEVLWAPYFAHVLEAWEKRNHPNLLFLFYEELSKDLPAVIRRVAKFLGKEVTEEQVQKLNEHLDFKNFKKNKTVNFEEFQESGVFTKGSGFVRRGKVGGWRDDFDEEMTEQAEKWIADNLRGTDFRFPHF